jgi:hypothetical protein
MDELFDSRIKLAYPQMYNFMFEKGDETEASKVQRNRANCPSFDVCVKWAKYQKNVSVLLADTLADVNYAIGAFIGESSEPLLCRLEDGVVFTTGLTMLMFHGDPLIRRVGEIIDRVIVAGIYHYWISLNFNLLNIYSGKMAIVSSRVRYYSFNLYHMQTPFYLLLMGWFLSALCFMFELLCNRLLSIRV